MKFEVTVVESVYNTCKRTAVEANLEIAICIYFNSSWHHILFNFSYSPYVWFVFCILRL